jgi:hypothetical protein
MNLTKQLLSILLLIAFCFSCKTKEKVTEESPKSSEQIVDAQDAEGQEEISEKDETQVIAINKALADSVVARIQRTACFGRCPIYTMTVFEGGKVVFEGKKWVDKEGTYEARVDDDKIEKLYSKANSVGFFDFESVYDNQYVTDLPSTITTLKREGKFKTVIGRYESPELLHEFENFFDSEFSRLAWEKVLLD